MLEYVQEVEKMFEFKDKNAKLIAEMLKITRDQDILKSQRISDSLMYAKVLKSFRKLEKDYFEDNTYKVKSDTFFELYSAFCDEYVLENFCAKVLYNKKINSSIYDKDIIAIGESRILQLYKILVKAEESKDTFAVKNYIAELFTGKDHKELSVDDNAKCFTKFNNIAKSIKLRSERLK